MHPISAPKILIVINLCIYYILGKKFISNLPNVGLESIFLECHHSFIALAKLRILAKSETWIRFSDNSVINLTFSMLTFSPTHSFLKPLQSED